MMTAVLSCTANDLYSFSLPFAVYSWHLVGIDAIVYYGMSNEREHRGQYLRLGMATKTMRDIAPKTIALAFDAPSDKIVTYAQCIRLYAAGEVQNTDILITSDADMCVFNQAYWEQFDCDGAVNIIGSDLVPQGQVPMCYIAAPVVGWRAFMEIKGRTAQQCVDDLLGHLEAEHFRGNYWSKDQETAFDALAPFEAIVRCHARALPGTQFATRRADRDGWHVTPDIIDAHLPRPGWTPENFAKIKELFHTMYPDKDHSWMDAYRESFIESMSLREG